MVLIAPLTKAAEVTTLIDFNITTLSDTEIQVTLNYENCSGEGRELIAYIDPERTMIQEHRAFIPQNGENVEVFKGLTPGIEYRFVLSKDIPGIMGTRRTSGSGSVLVGFQTILDNQALRAVVFVNASGTIDDIDVIIRNEENGSDATMTHVMKIPYDQIKWRSANSFDIPIEKYLNEKFIYIQLNANMLNGDTMATELLKISMPGATGINDVNNSLFTIYPNPLSNSDVLHIFSPLNGELSILDSKGQEVVHSDLENGSNILKNDLSSGIYFLKISNQETIITKKLLVK